MKRPVVRWDGATETEANQWTVRFILEREDGSKENYWYSFDAAPVLGERIDVTEPHFWAWAAYEGGKAIEDDRLQERHTGELLILERKIVEHRNAFPRVENPAIGEIVWRFGSPPYDDE